MPLTDAQALDAMADLDQPNEPSRLATAGASGPRELIPPHMSRARREAMSSLLQQGTSMDTIVQILSSAEPDPKTGKHGFGMSYDSIVNLRDEVWESWESEDAENRPHYKAATIRRMGREIVAARAAGSHSSVAMLEKALMDVQGTASPVEINVSGDVRQTKAIIQVFGEMEPAELRELVDDERRLYLAERNVIDVEGETVAE